MKKFTLTFFILLTFTFAIAQEKRLGVTLQVSSPSKDDVKLGWYTIDTESIDGYNLKHKSYATGLLFNYSVKNETVVRLRLGISKSYIDEYSRQYSSGILGTESSEGRQTKIHIAPGITWKMTKDKFSLYGGFELPINLHGKYTMDYTRTSSDSVTGTTLNHREQHISIPSGYSVGLGAIIGFNYFATKRISLGADFSPSLLYARLSGETTNVVTDDLDPNINQTTHTQDEDKGFTFYEQRFSINVSVWF
jgi:hypothetical protein